MNYKKRILYVDDDKEWREIIQDAISPIEYQLDFATSSKEAVERLRRKTYHVALLDKRLAELDPENQDGLALAEIVSGLHEGTEIIIYTSYGDDDDMRNAFRNIKVMDFIGKHKPITEIIRSIREASDRAETKFNRPTKRIPLELLALPEGVLSEFLSYVAIGDSRELSPDGLDAFAKHLLSEYHPLLTDKSDAKLLHISQIVILQVRFWSKTVGAPIAVWIGKKNEVTTLIENVEKDISLADTFGINHKLNDLLNYEPNLLLGGVLYELKNVEFSEFNDEFGFKP